MLWVVVPLASVIRTLLCVMVNVVRKKMEFDDKKRSSPGLQLIHVGGDELLDKDSFNPFKYALNVPR